MAKCQCESKPKIKKRTSTKKRSKPKVQTVKSNTGCMVKNVIIINGCCDSKKTESKRKSVKRKSRPKTVTERVEVIETPRTVRKKKRSYASPSPLVDYDSSDRPTKESTKRKSKAGTPKTNTVKRTSKKTESKKIKKESPPLIEVVDYDDGYRGKTLERRERKEKVKAIDSPRKSVETVKVIEEKPKKSLRESYREYKADRLARRTENVGRREETAIVESVPTYYVEESPKALPSPSRQETVYALPSGQDDLLDVSDCKNLTGKNREECEKRKIAQRKKRR